MKYPMRLVKAITNFFAWIIFLLYTVEAVKYTMHTLIQEGISASVLVSKLDLQTYTSEFESHWVPLSYGLVPHLSKKLCKLPRTNPGI